MCVSAELDSIKKPGKTEHKRLGDCGGLKGKASLCSGPPLIEHNVNSGRMQHRGMNVKDTLDEGKDSEGSARPVVLSKRSEGPHERVRKQRCRPVQLSENTVWQHRSAHFIGGSL